MVQYIKILFNQSKPIIETCLLFIFLIYNYISILKIYNSLTFENIVNLNCLKDMKSITKYIALQLAIII